MFGLSEKNIQQLIAVVSSIPEIEEVIVYGSRARGDNKPNSDVDLALKGKALTLNELAQLEEKIDYLYLSISASFPASRIRHCSETYRKRGRYSTVPDNAPKSTKTVSWY